MGFPIRKSTDQSFFAAPRGLSQRSTSFIASQRQGIHQMPLSHLITLIINAHSHSAWDGPTQSLSSSSHLRETYMTERPACFSGSNRQRSGSSSTDTFAPPRSLFACTAGADWMSVCGSCGRKQFVRARMISHARTIGTIPSSRCQTTSPSRQSRDGQDGFHGRKSLTRLVEPDGIEPTTSCLQSRRSPN